MNPHAIEVICPSGEPATIVNLDIIPHLTFYVVYESPTDYPGEFILRRHHMIDFQQFAEVDVWARGATLDEVRRHVPAGLFNIGREPSDHCDIVETWI